MTNLMPWKTENAQLKNRINALESKQDRAHQYSRRYSVRVSGIAETRGENTDDVVSALAEAIGANITLDEIDRSHRVGEIRPGSTKSRDILVKFATYRARQKLFKKRSSLKNSEYKRCFVNEDLTKKRNTLFFEARKLKRDKAVVDAWTSDGTVLVKDRRGKIRAINDLSDFELCHQVESYAAVARGACN